MSDPALGKAVLELSTDDTKLKSGLDDAQASADALGGKFKQAGQSAQEFTGHLDALGHSFVLRVTEGVLLRDAIHEILTGLKDLPSEFAEIVERGSKVQDVSDAFERLTQSTGGSVAVLAALRAGTKGTVDDFALMKAANVLLSDGVKLTADQFGTLAAGARLLAKQTGGDTAEAMEMLGKAMETGRGKALNSLGVHVNLDAALARYSVTVHKNVADLDDQEKQAAFTAEALRQLSGRLQETGDQSLSAGEKIKAGKVSLENLEDEVDRGIANSPVIAAAMDGIGTAFRHAFGDDQQAQVKTIVTLVGDVAIMAAKTAGFLLTLGNEIRDFFVTAGAGVQQLALNYSQSSQKEMEEFVRVQEGIAAKGDAGEKARLEQMRTRLDSLKAYNKTLTDEINGNLVANDKANKVVEQAQRDVAALIAEMEKAQKAHGDTAAAAGTHGKAIGDLGDTYHKTTAAQREQAKALAEILAAAIPLTAAQRDAAIADNLVGVSAATTAKALGISTEAVSRYLASLKESQEIADAWDKFNEHIAASSEKFIDKWITDSQKAALKVADAHAAALADQLVAAAEYEEKNYQLTLHGTDLQIELLEVQRRAAIAALTKRFADEGPLYQQALAQINKFFDTQEADIDKLAGKWDAALKMVGHSVSALASEIGGSFGKIVADIGKAESAAAAAGKAFAAMHEANKKGDSKAGLLDMAAGITDIASAAIAAGKAVAALWDHFFGSAGRDAVTAFAAKMGGFDVLHGKLTALGADGERLWIALTQGVGKNDPAAAKLAIDNITKALAAADAASATFNTSLNPLLTKLQALGGTLPTALIDALKQAGVLTAQNADLLTQLGASGGPTLQQLTALQQKYNLTTAQMGPAFQQANDTAGWQSIIDDLKTATDGGLDLNGVLAGMSPTIAKLVQDSLQFHTTIPANMRDTVQQLAAQGQLLDANGQKITDISQLTFGEDLPSSIDKLTLAVEKLTQAFEGTKSAVAQIPTSVQVDFHATKSGDWSGAGVGAGSPSDGTTQYPDAAASVAARMAAGAGLRLPAGLGAAMRAAAPSSGAGVASMAALQSIAAQPTEITVISKLDGKEVARNQVRYTPNRLAFLGVGPR